jgi:uncharacterized protein (TIGR02996 family)
MDRIQAVEHAIEINPDDRDAHMVLADYLQSKGDPRGEWISLLLAGKDAEAASHLEKHAAVLVGDLALHATTYDGEKRDAYTWKWGYVRAVRLSHNSYAEKLPGGLAPVLETLLAHPAGRFLAEATLTFNGDPNEDNLQSLIDLLAAAPRSALHKLHFGDFKYAGAARDIDRGDDTEISWYSVGNLSALWPSLPNLATLIVQTGSAESSLAGGTTLGTVALPALRHLEYRTGGLDEHNAASLVAVAAPKLVHLDIWTGSSTYGCGATADHIRTLLARTDLPELRHLGLMNCEFADELVELLVTSPLTRQLRELDLSLGCLTDDGAQLIAKHRDAFAHLDKLDVSYSMLGADGIAAVRGCAKSVITDEQRDNDDPDSRYCAVGE